MKFFFYLAIFIVAEKDPSSWFGGIGTLSYTMSLVFFGWFVAVFIMLSARALPSRGNLAEDLVYIAADAAKKLRAVFALPKFENLNKVRK